MSRSKYNAEQKYYIVKEYNEGIGTIREITTKYNIDKDTFYNWRRNYEKYGLDGLKESRTCKIYSKELKEKAVKDYLSGEYSLREITRKYNISDKKVVQRWINKYNGHREIKATAKGMSRSMTKGRSTSWKERIQIVLYSIAHDNDYQRTAELYKVSYQQVYQWVKKYESGGENALQDRRGKKKSGEKLTSEEKSKLKMKKLQVENERLRAENAFLKKLEELERGRP